MSALLTKYITFDSDLGMRVAVIVPVVVQHHQACNPQTNLRPRSAGFFTLEDGRVQVEPTGSTSLNLKPLPDDAEVIETTLRLSGLL